MHVCSVLSQKKGSSLGQYVEHLSIDEGVAEHERWQQARDARAHAMGTMSCQPDIFYNIK